MRILVVEDDEFKRRRVVGFLTNSYQVISVDERASFQSGLEAIMAASYDLAILDMSMPTFDISPEEDGGRHQAYAGKKILHQMVRREMKTPVVILTQYALFGEGAKQLTLEDLDKELKQECSPIYKGAVYYHATEDAWQRDLKLIIDRLRKAMAVRA